MFWCVFLHISGIGQKSYTLKQYGLLFQTNRLDSHCIESVASAGFLYKKPSQDTLLFGKPLRAWSTNGRFERTPRLRVMNSGMVKMNKIGQPACLSSKSEQVGYDEASETERVSVDNDGLAIQSLLKIQSIPLGKLRGIEIPTKQCHSMCMTSKTYKKITAYSFLFKILSRILLFNLVSGKMIYLYLRIKRDDLLRPCRKSYQTLMTSVKCYCKTSQMMTNDYLYRVSKHTFTMEMTIVLLLLICKMFGNG